MGIYMKNEDAKQCDNKIIITYDRKSCELGMYDRRADINIAEFEAEKKEQVIWWKEFDFLPPQAYETLKYLCLATILTTTRGNHEERINKIQWHLLKWGKDGYRVIEGTAEEAFDKLIAS